MRMFPFLMALAGVLHAQEMPRSLSLAERVWVVLDPDWVERRNEDPPPLSQLVASAPRLNFTDIAAAEDRKNLAVLKLGFSENAFEGSTAPELDARMHAAGGDPEHTLRAAGVGLAGHLFYFFFPPPRNCLVKAEAALEKARLEEIARVLREQQKESTPSKVNLPRTVTVTQTCEFSSSPLDFFAEQISPGVMLDSSGRSTPLPGSFYVPPMEQVEIAGRTFFIFEAQGQRPIARAELDRYNLPEQLQGARAHLFWALGAESPFPFVRDPLRKNVQLIHVAYGCLSTTGEARPRFLEKLRSLRFAGS